MAAQRPVCIVETNNDFARHIATVLTLERLDSGTDYGQLSPAAAAGQIFANKGRAELVLINAEVALLNEKRHHFNGVELLMWLRIRHDFRCPIVLYGFLNCSQLLSLHPDFFLLLAPGNSYLQLPFDFNGLDIEKLIANTPLKNTKFNIKDAYTPFIKPAFSIEKFRHREANWWGIKCLHDVHRLVSKQPKDKFPYNPEVEVQLGKLENSIANFLFEVPKEKLGSASTRFEPAINLIRKALQKQRPKVLYIDDKFDSGWSDVLASMIFGETEVEERKYERVYRSGGEAVLFCLKNVGEMDMQPLANLLDRRFDNSFKKINLVLLDLRLKDDEELRNEVEKLSGFELLKYFREKRKGIPVVITTASNKVWSYERLLSIGADGYWIKEGLDEQRGAEDSVQNYLRLLELVSHVSSSGYGLLKDLSTTVEKLKHGKTFWWETPKTWKNGAQSPVSSRAVFVAYLEKTQELLRAYLQKFGTDLRNQDQGGSKAHWLSSIIIQLNFVFETLHSTFDSTEVGGGIDKSTRQFVYRREDWIACYFMRIRNNSAHPKLGFKLEDFEIVQMAARLLFYYLDSQLFHQLDCPKKKEFHDFYSWDATKNALQKLITHNNLSINAS